MSWYWIALIVLLYLMIGGSVAVGTIRISFFEEAFGRSNLSLAGMTLLWPFILVILIVYIIMTVLGMIISWLDKRIGEI